MVGMRSQYSKQASTQIAGNCFIEQVNILVWNNILSPNRTTETGINSVSKQFTGLGVLLQWLLAANLGITRMKTYKKWQSKIILECIFQNTVPQSVIPFTFILVNFYNMV